jgi:hypothetical protein
MPKAFNPLRAFGKGKASARTKAEDAAQEEDEKKAVDPADPEKEEAEDDPEKKAVDPADPEEEEDEEDMDPESDDGAVPADKKEAAAYRRGMAAGRRKEQARTAAVLSAPITKGRENTAALLLAGGHASSRDIITALASVPKAGGQLDAAMRQMGNPPTGPGFSSQPTPPQSLAEKQAARQKAKAEAQTARK